MKDFTLVPLNNYHFKKIGIGITGVSLLLLLLSPGLELFKVVSTWTLEQNENLLKVLLGFGLYTIVFSQEKEEDERVAHIRGRALRFGFMILTAVSLSLGIVGITFDATSSFSPIHLAELTAMVLLVYLVYFYYSLYFDPKGNYTENTPSENYSKNKRMVVIRVVSGIILLILYLLLKS